MVFLTSVIGSIFIDAEIAQLVEQRIRNAWVEGSSPFFGLKYGRLPAKDLVTGTVCWQPFVAILVALLEEAGYGYT